MAQGKYGTESLPLESITTDRVAYEPLTSDPSETYKGSSWFRDDLDSGDKIGTIRFQNDDDGNDIFDIPAFSESEGVTGVVKVRAIQTADGEAFIPMVEEGGAFPQWRFQHNGTWYGAHNATSIGASEWEFDEGSGTTAIDSWGDNDGTINGASYTTDAQVGSHALSFDGTNDYVDVSDVDADLQDAENPHTIVAWIHVNNFPGSGNDIIFDHEGRLGISVNDSQQGRYRLFDDVASTDTAITSPALAEQTWYQIAARFDPSADEMTLFVNGSSESTATEDRWDKFSSNVAIGSNGDGSTSFFDGRIDNVQVYDQALSDSQVSELYAVNLWTREKSINPFYDGKDQTWSDWTLDTMDTLVDPNDSSQLLFIYSAAEDTTGGSDESRWDIGTGTIDLDTGYGAFTPDASNPTLPSSTGIGDPTLIYNSDGTPANYQVWTWAEDSSGNDVIRYYTGSAIDNLTEHSSSPVIEPGGTKHTKPTVTYDTANSEYVLFVQVGGGVDRYTSSDGESWTQTDTITTFATIDALVKEASDGTFFVRPKKEAGGEAWYMISGAGGIYKSTDKGKTWALYEPTIFGDDAESWESGLTGDFAPVKLDDGTWLIYYKGDETAGDPVEGWGVATVNDFP